jgi:retron-type reverse transcriptase
MSMHGRTRAVDAEILSGVVNAKWVIRHRGSANDFLPKYRRLAAQAVAEKRAGLRAIAPKLLWLIADQRTLFAAWQYLAANGGSAPGPDGYRYDDFSRTDVWHLCRNLRDEIRSGQYAVGPERVRRIRKASGRGWRPLVIQSIFDRVVQRAAVEIIQPLLDPLFDPLSFGYRPGRGPLRALLAAERACLDGRLGVWVSADLADAFTNVPIGRPMPIVRAYFPDNRLVGFIEATARTNKIPGLRQGGPLSPLLLNLYLHHLLDRKWRRLCPDTPLFRFADDLLVMCQRPAQARAAYRYLDRLLQPTGLRLKEKEADAVKWLSRSEPVKWMGFGIRLAGDDLRYTVTDHAWASLAERFDEAQAKANSPMAAAASLFGWLADKAPCFPTVDINRAYDRIRTLGAERGFDELPERYEIQAYWKRAYARWCKLRSATPYSI